MKEIPAYIWSRPKKNKFAVFNINTSRDMRKEYLLVLVALFVALFSSCSLLGLAKPNSFIASSTGGDWASIVLRDGLDYEKAFGEVLDICARRFEMDMISKESGYARSNWTYTWNTKGQYTQKYRARIIFKFSTDRTRVDIKAEAEFGGEENWIKGYDTRLLQTMKQDIQGAVGRVVM